jgi:hypothetical protein
LETKRKIIAAVACALGAAGVIAAVTMPASASTGQVQRIPIAGAVFACNDGTTYTVTGGTAVFVGHQSTDAQGGLHLTGTVAPSGVTAVHSSDSGSYRIVGASWFGFNLNPDGSSVGTDTAEFEILSATGPVATVHAVDHVGPNGEFVIDFGSCEEPQD